MLIDVQRIGSGLRIEVTDAGPGVPADEQARVFEPFFRGRVQPVDGLPGTGIGLSIVAETVRAHGGQVSVLAPESTTAGATPGSRFRIDIPHALSD